jgi:hypothetical protein
LALERDPSAASTLRLHNTGTAMRTTETVELKAMTRYEVLLLTPDLCGRIAVDVLASHDSGMGQPAEKPKG